MNERMAPPPDITVVVPPVEVCPALRQFPCGAPAASTSRHANWREALALWRPQGECTW